ncbi:MAG TPA: sugar nucleotide-binding protein, partial [Roseiflexaceae bacterium]|nr:sugar nucleotide-binding protein [Roseiflexaceae bacterium]
EQEAAYTETDPPSPVHPYGVAKAAAEQLVAEAHPMASIVRTSLIYGGPTPGPHERIVFDALSGRADIVFFTDERRCPIAVADLAAALLELVPLDHAGPLHIAGAETISRYAFACAVAGAAGYRTDGLRSGLSTASGRRRPRNCALRIDRARALLTTPLRGVSDVLGNTVG